MTGARGDKDDVFSHGFICPKGDSFAELDNDPDRLTRPLVRRDGVLTAATWEEAFAAVADGLGKVIAEHGGASAGVYLGNPNAHTIAGGLYTPVVVKALGTRQVYSASTLDQMPKHVALGYRFGNPVAFTVPDLDRTDYLVVIDPARTRTAELADRHLAPRPGTDAALLLGVVHVLFDEDLVDLEALAGLADGVEALRALAADFTPNVVAAHCDVPADDIRTLAREVAAAPSAAVYGRIGTSTVEFGTLGSWLVDVVNILTGNLDRPGGAMFPCSTIAAAPRPPKPGRGFLTGRWHSRVSGYPEALSEFPAAALAEEIETPGDGQIKAVLTIAGNPVLSAPDGDRLDRALAGVEFMLSIDPYLNETTRHADVILPPPPPSRSLHFDVALNALAVRNNARYSSPVLALSDRPDETEILSRIALLLCGIGVDGDRRSGLTRRRALRRRTDRDAARRPGYERRLDMMLRLGAYGDAFGARPGGLTLAELKAAPHGIDLGPLRPRLAEVLRTPTGRVELAPAPLLAEAVRLREALGSRTDGFVLIGRRHLRSNNSWMHNVPSLAGGSNRCTLRIHPDDAADLGLTDTAVVKGPGGELLAPIELAPGVRRGAQRHPGRHHTCRLSRQCGCSRLSRPVRPAPRRPSP